MKKKNLSLLFINIIIVVSTIIVSVLGIANGASQGQVGENISGINYFKPFTMDSNILNALFCFVVLIFNLNNLIGKKDEIPAWAIKIQYIGTSAVTLTFITVLIFLAPMQVLMGNSYWLFFKNDMFFFHFLNPVLSLIECLILHKYTILTRKDNLCAVLPTFIYSIWYMYNVINENWSDFYGFTFGGKYHLIPLVLIIMYSVTYLIGLILRKAKI